MLEMAFLVMFSALPPQDAAPHTPPAVVAQEAQAAPKVDWKRPAVLYTAVLGLNLYTTHRQLQAGGHELNPNPALQGGTGRAAAFRLAQDAFFIWADVYLQRHGQPGKAKALRFLVAGLYLAASFLDALPLGE